MSCFEQCASLAVQYATCTLAIQKEVHGPCAHYVRFCGQRVFWSKLQVLTLSAVAYWDHRALVLGICCILLAAAVQYSLLRVVDVRHKVHDLLMTSLQ